MGEQNISVVKRIEIKAINAGYANMFMRHYHYSHKVVPNSQLHLGCFLDGLLKGVMQFGPSMDKKRLIGLVKGTGWNNFIELNRMAFTDDLPKNSESRCLGIAMRILKREAPHIQWVISFADATLSGHGTIYQASNFVLTGIKKNNSTYQLPGGEVVNRLTASAHRAHLQQGATGSKWITDQGGVVVPGFQLRYIYFVDPACRKLLTVPEIPFAQVHAKGALMYKGMRGKHSNDAAGFQPAEGGAAPTTAHQGN